MSAKVKEREQMRQEITAYSRRLMLSSGVAELCVAEATPRQEQFLHRVLSEEMARRERNKKTRLLKRAGFPVLK
ncbi:MAG: ATP-binding protein, partial [Kiritimatiellia bacterium]|nr:ATP-binding protein [Kiritimatiellia bacterium]